MSLWKPESARFLFASLLCLAAGSSSAPPARAVELRSRALAGELFAAPLETVDRQQLAALDRPALAREDLERDRQGLPFRFAQPNGVSLTPANSGTWESPAEGLDLWRLRIDSPGATSLNLGFGRCRLPEGAELAIHSPLEPQQVLVFTAADNKPHGQLWTPLLPGAELVVELALPASSRRKLELELTSIASGYRGFMDPDPEKGDWCEVDVVCPEGDPWREEIAAVGVYTLEGWWKCTGTLLDNTAEDGRPLFLTAYHCDITAANAASMVVYWNFQSPVCGQQGGGSLASYQGGATLLAGYSTSDFSLVELDDVPDAALGVNYAGWDRSAAVPDSVVCIHHPQTDEKSISFDYDPTRVTSWAQESSPGNGTHLMVADWDLGTTEGGSSGSALFNSDHRVVGQLHGGYAACDNDDPDWFGRLYTSWTGGGTPAARLSDYLDPLGTGLEAFPAVFPPSLPAYAAWAPSGPRGGPFLPAQVTLTLANRTLVDHDVTLGLDVEWLDLSIEELAVAAGQEVTFTLTLNDAAKALPAGDHEARLFVADVDSGGERTYRTILRVGGPAGLALQDAAPNPFSSYVELSFSLASALPYRTRIWDLHGRLVRDLGTRQGVRGLNAVAWDGCNDGGARVAAGVYIGQIESGGEEARTRLLAIH